MIELVWPWMLLALPLPALVYLLIPPAQTQATALPVPFYSRIAGHGRESSARKNPWTIVLLALAWIALVAASTRPQWLGEPASIPVSGRDVMLAVDISGSMKAEDMVHNGNLENRLDTVKRVATDFIQRREGDRIGLILFGTHAYVQAPLTFDRETVVTLLDEAAIGIAGEKTAIGDAVGLAVKRLKVHYEDIAGAEESEKVLILLTDGANTAGSVDPVEAASLAGQIGLKIYAIGVGAESTRANTVFGQTLLSSSGELDEKSLTRMAELTGGQYFRATDPASLEDIYVLIDQFEPVVDEDRVLRPRSELFHWLLGLSVFLVLTLILGRIIALPSGSAHRSPARPRDLVTGSN